MITGWGAHHVDSAHWGMNAEYTGPVEIWGWAEFPTHGLWDVHGKFKTECIYPDGVHMAVGVATANSILMITFANDQRKEHEGLSAHDAALAAGLTRLRPVVMLRICLPPAAATLRAMLNFPSMARPCLSA